METHPPNDSGQLTNLNSVVNLISLQSISRYAFCHTVKNLLIAHCDPQDFIDQLENNEFRRENIIIKA